ncbi:hypothetical protein RI129_004990 [Pyrocoelia pectoralis]|uniref:E3 ubiquitin-protein ligase PPP1R11 n=1 Tax=Pyrocoelia pectoralis TaxID=417401 RepID=A0AAN7VJA1_9COLE
MAEPMPANQPVQVQDSTSSTVTIVAADVQDGALPTLHLKLRKPKIDKKVQWTNETVDNEDMNKKKSSCCCIYTKPKTIDDDDSSSSDISDDECDHCKGHIEKKKHKRNKGHLPDCIIPGSSNENNIEGDSNPEPSFN